MMNLTRNPHRNPVLEIKREGYLAAGKNIRDDLLETYKETIFKTKHIHANLLFTTQYGYSILRDICRLVTYVDPGVINTNWRDLAVKLGYDNVDVKCINNLRGNVYDPTELVLQYYAATKKEGTVGEILQALLELGFLPALHQAQTHIESFLAEVENGKADVIESSIDIETETKVLKAANFKPLVPAVFNPLPPKKCTIGCTVEVARCDSLKETEAIQQARPQAHTKQHKVYCRYVMLSFASDGYDTALNVAAVLRATTNKKGVPIGVMMLCENDDKVLENPGQIITDILSKMDFVIPVLTEGYFAALKQPNVRSRLLDERYVQFVHDILVSKYIHNNCLNVQVRPVIPRQAIDSIYHKEEFIHNAVFNAWKSDDEIKTLADNILKSHRSKITPQ